MPEIERALEQIAEIHDQLAITREVGVLQSVPAFLSGAVGLLGVALVPFFADLTSGREFLQYWCGAAVLGLLLGGGNLLYVYWKEATDFGRGQLRGLVALFGPSLFVGTLVSLAAYELERFPVSLMPGLWALIFGLGLFATRSLLPRAIGWVALYYLVTGAVLLAVVSGPIPPGWTVGGVFGIGQLVAGLVLWRNRERQQR